jgi:hypothetical protein
MPCTSTGYIVNGTKWKEHSQGKITAQTANVFSHAERKAFNGFSNKPGPYLIVQDAFPCFDHCHQHFLTISKSTTKQGKNKGETITIPGASVIIKVTANNTYDMQSYIAAGLVTFGCFPWYIYYLKGEAAFSMAFPAPPEGFPTHPGPQDV